MRRIMTAAAAAAVYLGRVIRGKDINGDAQPSRPPAPAPLAEEGKKDKGFRCQRCKYYT